MVALRPPPEGWLDIADVIGPDDGAISIRGDGMTKEMFMDIIRTVMKVLGGMVLATSTAKAGGLDTTSWATLTSAALVVGSFGWSIWSTYHFTK